MSSAARPLDELIAAERPYLLRLATLRLRNTEESEDVVQSTLAAALAGATGFRGHSTLRTWLTAILMNRLADLRHLRRREPLVADLADGTGPTGVEPGVAPDTADVVHALQLARALQSGLDRLPPDFYRPFVMSELEGRTSREIKDCLRLSPSQFWQRMHKARHALRRAISASADSNQQETTPTQGSHHE